MTNRAPSVPTRRVNCFIFAKPAAPISAISGEVSGSERLVRRSNTASVGSIHG